MSKQFKEYFRFSKAEQKGVIALLGIIGLLFITRYCIINFYPKSEIDKTNIAELQRKLDSLILHEKNQKENKKKRYNLSKSLPKVEEEFDPNLLSKIEWMGFGLSEKQTQVLLNYKDKAGGFKSKQQVEKMFVISEELYAAMHPFILLPDSTPKKQYQNNKEFEKWERKKYKKKVYPKVQINSADTSEFKALYGIGEVLAERIVKRREELGGFIAKDQLNEIFGLSEETLIRLDTQLLFERTEIQKININTATKEELKTHPYIFWQYANVIVNYRKQHGNYSSLEDLKKIVIIDDSLYQKVKPYLTY